jgi:hypothetical protein
MALTADEIGDMIVRLLFFDNERVDYFFHMHVREKWTLSNTYSKHG